MGCFFLYLLCFYFNFSCISAVTIDPSSPGGIRNIISIASTGDTILLSGGLYSGPDNCDLIVDKSLAIVGLNGSAQTFIDCQHVSRCLTVAGPNVQLNVSGISFRNGQHQGLINTYLLPSSDFGGCMLIVNNASASFSGIAVSGCYSSQGGGIGAFFATNIVVQDSWFHFNGMTSNVPGIDLRGGAIYFLDGSYITIVRTVIEFNFLNLQLGTMQTAGAGVCIRGNVRGDIMATVTDTVFTGNTISSNATGQVRGAALYLTGIGYGIVNNVSCSFNSITFSGSAQMYGAGVYANAVVSILITDLVAHGNTLTATPFIVRGGGLVGGAGVFAANVIIANFSNGLSITNNKILASSDLSGAVGAGIAFSNSITISLAATVVDISSNSIYQIGDGQVAGSAIQFTACNTVLVPSTVALLLVQKNQLNSSGSGDLTGTMFLEGSALFLLAARSVIMTNNVISNTDAGRVQGGGLFVKNCFNTSILAETVKITDNRVAGSEKRQIQPTTPYVTILTNDTRHCLSGSPVVIASTSGVLSQGSWGKYSVNINCVWTISPTNAFNQAFGRLNARFTSFDVEFAIGCTNDWVSLYDGTTTRSPLIGTYCGWSSTGNPSCSKGACPPSSSILLSGASLTVVFHSDQNRVGNGFKLQWNLIESTGFATGDAGMVPDLTEARSFAIGGGIVFSGGAATIFASELLTISRNSAFHLIYALGGGLAAIYGSTVTISGPSSTIERNSVTGMIATGGGITALENGGIVIRGEIRDNAVIGIDMCFPSPVDDKVRCCAALGGGVSAAIGGWINGTSALIAENTASCFGPMCLSQGGGVAVTRFGYHVTLSIIDCIGNQIFCSPDDGCALGCGGCISVDDGNVNILSNSTIEQNMVNGAGNGGGIAVLNIGKLNVQSSSLSRNIAAEGAGLWMTDQTVVSINNASFSSNTASVAGAIAATQNSHLNATNISLINNTASSRAAAILSFSDNSKGQYSLSNLEIISAELGSVTIMLGRVFVSSLVTNCSLPGTIVQQEVTMGEFFSVSCIQCGSGTYAAEPGSSLFDPPRACNSCPLGAECLGSNTTSNGLLALAQFWGSLGSNGEVKFFQCPNGYCCSRGSCYPFNFCNGRRIGTLCGECSPSQGLSFFSTSCGNNSNCSQAGWAIPIALIGCIAFGGWLVISQGSKGNSDGIFAVLLFFYQIAPLVKSSPWTSSLMPLIGALQSFFSLSDSASEGSRLCLIPGMTAAQKESARIIFQAVILLSIGIVMALHWGLRRILWIRSRFSSIENLRVCRAVYIPVVVRFLTIAYTTIVLVPLAMVQCLTINNKNVWWLDGNVECYQNWQYVAFAAIGVLSPLPMLVIIALQLKWIAQDHPLEWRRELHRLFTGPFRRERQWWLGISLYRRLIIVVCYTTITNLVWRGIVLSSLCTFFLMAHLIMHPLREKHVHCAETGSLLLLLLLSIFSSPQFANIEFGSTQRISNEAALEMAQLVMCLLPLSGFFGMRLFIFTMTVRAKHGQLEIAKNEMSSAKKGSVSNFKQLSGARQSKENHKLQEDNFVEMESLGSQQTA